MNTFCFILALLWQSAHRFTEAFATSKTSSLVTNKKTTKIRSPIQPLHAKRKFTINTNLSGDVKSDGLLADRKSEQEKRATTKASVKSNLGKKGNPEKKKSNNNAGKSAVPAWKAKKTEDLAKQRNGDVDSTFQSGSTLPADQSVQIKVSKRGNKSITLVRGLAISMDDRKKMLKELKSKLGGGGAMIDGVLELQGAHGEKIVEILKKKGYSSAKLLE